MEITINKGEKKPKMTYELFLWKFFSKIFGLLRIDMGMWKYSSSQIAHLVVGVKSFFSSNGVAIIVSPDNHPGRFKAYASLVDGDNKRAVFITYIYNNRGYGYDIIRYKNKWVASVNGKHVMLDVKRTPIFTYNLLPRLSEKMDIEKDVIIEL